MATSPRTSYEEMARQSLEDDPHYVALVTDMADHMEVLASEDIYSVNGHKLVLKDTVIRSNLKEGLLKHKLLKPIDQSLMVENAVTALSLAREAARLTEEDPRIQHLAYCLGDTLAPPRQLASLSLSPQMAFKLTVAKEQQPHLFQHLLLVTVIAQYLALSVKLPTVDMPRVLCTALFHDLGELHTDPALLNSRRRLSITEWHHIYAHPITGYLIAREAVGVDPAVAIAILQHQERLDGSGYPYGLRGKQIGALARIVSVADVCASLLARFGSNERLSTLMRLNREKYAPELLTLLHRGFGGGTTSSAVTDMAPLPRLKAVAQLLDRWGEFRATLSGDGGSDPHSKLGFLLERMVSLHSMLLQFGFDPDSLQLLVELWANDQEIAQELTAALDELDWQFKDLERETTHRREAIRASLSSDGNRLFDGWIGELQAYLFTP